MEALKTKIPKLRFPEFKDNWVKQKLNSHIELLSGFAFKGDDIEEDSKGHPILRGINITEGYIRHNPDIDRFYSKPLDKVRRFLLRKDDLVLGMDGSKVGKNVALITKEDEGSLLIQRVARIRAKSTTDIRYIFLNIFSYRFHRYVDKVNTSSGIPHISAKQIKEFEIGFPSKPEQEKISTFLSSVDKKIDQLQKKKELLEQYKKGMMQKIFKQEIRFKDENGKDFPEWKESTMEKVFNFYSTNSFSRDNLNDSNGNVLNIHYGDIHTKFKSIVDVEKESIPFINDDIDLSKIKNESYCQNGDLVFADASEDYNDIGKAIELFNIRNLSVLAGLHTILARPKKNKFSKGFLGQYVRHWRYKKQVMLIAQGTKVLGISVNRLKKVKLFMPCLEEQAKIANFLSAIDDKVDLVATEIEKASQFKKGLLQQMFI